MKHIFEVPVYDGARKVWRVLNLNTGTVYASEFDDEKLAFDSINDGEKRAGMTVRRVQFAHLKEVVDRNLSLRRPPVTGEVTDFQAHSDKWKPVHINSQADALTSSVQCECCGVFGEWKYFGFRNGRILVSISQCQACGDEQQY